ncbi:MAG: CPBP family intramembrane metalloprotease [Verrucomicrobia bacterium]|nr:CPBP family intramembrane metalloprotease [Verrucomicrobiota bacterium]
MDELTQSLDAFGPWDWACVIANLLVAIIGLFALKCWRNLPGKSAAPTTSVGDAVIGLSTGLLSFGILFGVVTGLVSQAFSTHFGISQAHLFTAAFCGQLAAAATMLAMGALAPKTLGWAPSIETDEPKPAGSAFRHALRAFSFPRVLLGLLAIFALGLAATLLWKGFHVAWEQLFLRGWAGQPPADEPQEIVDAVLKTDVDTWRFLTITLAVTIGAPIMEELAFRGMIYPGLRRISIGSEKYGRWIAVGLTGALFSAAHLSPSAALPLFAFGAFMCLVRDRYGLLTCMAIHCSFNLWNLVWLKLAPNASTL